MLFSYQAMLLSLWGAKYLVDSPRQIPNSGSVTSPKIHPFSCLFSRPKKSKNRAPRLPKNDKTRPQHALKTNSMTIHFLQHLLKMTWKRARKQIQISSLSTQKTAKQSLKIEPSQWKSSSGPPRALPASSMVLRSSPEMPKWSPRVPKRRCKWQFLLAEWS